MRLQILSDLHLEFGVSRLPSVEADVVVLAGDIHLGRDGRKWARKTFSDKPVVYVLGNHEFYRHSLPDLTETLQRQAEGSQIHVLENTAAEIGGFTFLGCTLWTDFQAGIDKELAVLIAEAYMSDYGQIQYGPEKRLLRARDTIKAHVQSVAWLRNMLQKCDPAKTIIVTHHAPSARSQPDFFKYSRLTGAFVSNLESLVECCRIPLWIHGHTHYNVDYRIGVTRVLTNQRGYPDEICEGFDPELVVTI